MPSDGWHPLYVIFVQDGKQAHKNLFLNIEFREFLLTGFNGIGWKEDRRTITYSWSRQITP